ncbi:ribonuclease [candidate division BRC1 bacterium SM23_51]|nr:MAG: ribonuclease [candidate division BRC1 bacterium SM23_51]
MVLVDTSVWVSHLRGAERRLAPLLQEADVACHPFVVGELALGNLRNRSEILTLLEALPAVEVADHDEVMRFIVNHKLMAKGLGYVDVHLLASAVLSGVSIWTTDRRLAQAAVRLGVAHAHKS